MLKPNYSKAKILIIEDDATTIRLLSEMLFKEGFENLVSLTDPEEAVNTYKQFQPDLLILDINMPRKNGLQIMKELHHDDEYYLPVLVISEESDPDIKFQALQSGAKDFLNKPYDRVEIILRIRNLIDSKMLHNQTADQNRLLEDKVKERTQELYNTQLDAIQRLARAIEYRDSETGLHILRMSHYCAILAGKIGMSMSDCDLILTASPLHDIGKIGIPDSILRKPGKLTDEEWKIMKTHTTIGAELLGGSNSKFLKMASEISLTHHEKWDGSGYPNQLKGDEIPLVGRICGLCDVFDALTSDRPYKNIWTLKETVTEIREKKGIHFDPELVDAFLEILPEIIKIKDKYVDPALDQSH